MVGAPVSGSPSYCGLKTSRRSKSECRRRGGFAGTQTIWVTVRRKRRRQEVTVAQDNGFLVLPHKSLIGEFGNNNRDSFKYAFLLVSLIPFSRFTSKCGFWFLHCNWSVNRANCFCTSEWINERKQQALFCLHSQWIRTWQRRGGGGRTETEVVGRNSWVA